MTSIKSLAELKRLPAGTPIYLENHVIPARSRHTSVHSNHSHFFTVTSKEGDEQKESWIFDAKNAPKVNQIIFGEGKTHIMTKEGKPFLTIYTDPKFIATFPKR